MVRGKPRRLVDEKKIVADYNDNRLVKEILEEHDLSRSFFNAILKRHGVVPRRRIGEHYDFNEHKVPESVVDEFKEGVSVRQIAKNNKVSLSAVSNFLQKKSIREIKEQFKYSVNSDFFEKIDSEESAYWFGFFGADGWIGSNGEIGMALKESDASHLYKFKQTIGFSGPVVERKRRRTYPNGEEGWSYEVQVLFKDAKMYSDLKKLGMIVDKSRALLLDLSLVPGELERHFWRGVVDGDGTLSNVDGRSLEICLCGTRDVCDKFNEFCYKVTGFKYSVGNRESWFVVCVSSGSSVQLAKVLYHDSKIFLDRKKSIAENRFNINSCIWKIRRSVAEEFLEKNHYLGSVPIGVSCYGWVS